MEDTASSGGLHQPLERDACVEKECGEMIKKISSVFSSARTTGSSKSR